MLRFWESKFSQIRPVKRAGGRRYYRPEDIDLLRGIRALLYSDGLTIRGVQKVFKDRGVRHVGMIGRGDHYALEVTGDSMINAGILDGDTVIIQESDTANTGEIRFTVIQSPASL